MSIYTEIQRIQNAKYEIHNSLERIGIFVNRNEKIDKYPIIIEPITKGKEFTYLTKDQNYLTFKFVQDGEFYWKSSDNSFFAEIEYCKNGGSWTTVESPGLVCNVEVDDEIWIIGYNDKYCNDDVDVYCYFELTAKAYISGNILSMVDFSDQALESYAFTKLFYNCQYIDIDIQQELLLPSTSLGDYAYYKMFEGCTNLVTSPSLPATTLGDYCYGCMFKNCIRLTTSTELPATTLTEGCYYEMFSGCGNMTNAPELPATTLVNACYRTMFYNCSNLNHVRILASTIPSTYNQSGYGCLYQWLGNVSSSGTFEKLTNTTFLQATKQATCHGIPFGWTVVNL